MEDEIKEQRILGEKEVESIISQKLEERALVTAGQRKINFIWEATQAIVAIAVTLTSLYVAAALVLTGNENQAAFLLLSNAFFLIIGSYFSRTNHQKIGGIGAKEYDDQDYKGR